MNDLFKTARVKDAALRDAFAAEVCAMPDAEVRAEAQALGIDLDEISAMVGAARSRANGQNADARTDKVVILDGKRAQAIVRRAAEKRRIPQALRLVAGLHAPTDAEAIEVVKDLDALGLLPDEDINEPDS